MGFIANDPVSYDAMQRRRKVAEAMLAQSTAGVASNPWEGLAQIGQAIAGKVNERRADSIEERGKADATDAYRKVVEAMTRGGGMAAPEITPQPAAAQPEAWTDRIARIIGVESGGDPNAVSPKGATGLMQIMPATARDPGYGVPDVFTMAQGMGRQVPDQSDATLQTLLRDPQVNTAFGSAYQSAMDTKFGDPRLAHAAYNAGPGAVEQYGGVPPFAETQAYVEKLAGPGGAPPVTEQPLPPQGQPAQPMQQGLDPALLELAGNEFLSPQQQMVAQALLQGQLRGVMPMSAAERLQAEKLGLEVEQLRGGMTPYQRAQIDLERDKLERDNRTSERGTYGLSPIYGVGPDGKPVIMQLGNRGGVEVVQMPDGVEVARDPIRVDAGTATVLLDPITRQPIASIPKDVAGEAAQSEIGKAEGSRTGSAPKVVQQADLMLADIDAALADPQLGNALGWSSYLPFDVPGYNAQPRSRVEKIQGQAFLQAFESLKGGGAITEIEGKKAESAIARLRTTQTEGEFKAALGELADVIRGARQRAAQRLGAAPEVQDAAPQPRPQGNRTLRYNPATGELE